MTVIWLFQWKAARGQSHAVVTSRLHLSQYFAAMAQRYIQKWEDLRGNRFSAPVKEPAATYVRLLSGNLEAAADFFMTYGGGLLYAAVEGTQFTGEPGPIRQTFGDEGARALAAAFSSGGGGSIRIPTAKIFVARALRGRGLATSAIAREMSASDTAVRNWLKPDEVLQRRNEKLRRKALLAALEEAETELCPMCRARLRGRPVPHANDEKRQPANDRPAGRVVMRLSKVV